MTTPLDEETIRELWRTTPQAIRARWLRELRMERAAYDPIPPEADPRSYTRRCVYASCGCPFVVKPTGARRLYCSKQCVAAADYWRHVDAYRTRKRANYLRHKAKGGPL